MQPDVRSSILMHFRCEVFVGEGFFIVPGTSVELKFSSCRPPARYPAGLVRRTENMPEDKRESKEFWGPTGPLDITGPAGRSMLHPTCRSFPLMLKRRSV
jgi:hypothetical protein